jgi:hypothetical protein
MRQGTIDGGGLPVRRDNGAWLDFGGGTPLGPLWLGLVLILRRWLRKILCIRERVHFPVLWGVGDG